MESILGASQRVIALTLVLSICIFMIDISVPLGVAGGVLYFVVILVSLAARSRGFIIYVAILCSVLTVLGYFFSPAGGEPWKVMANRVLAYLVIWITTMLSLKRRVAEDALNEAHNELEIRVEDRTRKLRKEIEERERVEEALCKAKEELEMRVEERTKELSGEISERKRAEEILTIKNSALESSINAIALADLKGNLTYVNPSFLKTWGYYDVKEVLGKSAIKFWQEEEKAIEIVETLQDKGSFFGELSAKRKNDSFFNVQLSASMVKNDTGNPICMMASFVDITDRKLAEKHMQESLKEKEVLLQEIRHRVKNNLQISCSLLNIQSRYIEDKTAHDAFKESQNRIRAMALLHEKLCQSDNMSNIDFPHYVQSLTDTLFVANNSNFKAIKSKVDISNISIDVDTSLHLGLILNELCTNTLKHAFPDGNNGEVRIVCHPKGDNKCELAVSDNGIGLPDNFNLKSAKTMGLQLVDSMVKQMKGEIKVDGRGGASFKITFPYVKNLYRDMKP